MCIVKECWVNGVRAYGICNESNDKWFFYAYKTAGTARDVLVRADFDNDPLALYVNVSMDKAYKISDFEIL